MNSGIPYQKIEELNNDFQAINNLELTDDDKLEIQGMIDEIIKDEETNPYKKGQMLENLIIKILRSTKIFKCIHNGHTTSNEFDVLVVLNYQGRNLRDKEIIPKWIPDSFLIECKNYKNDVGVSYVGKFYSLIDVSNCELGIFLSRTGVSGRDKSYWDDAVAFIKKINLKYSESNKKRILLDLNLDDIKKVLSEFNIVEIIENRKIEIDTDITDSIIEWIKPHENESRISDKQ